MSYHRTITRNLRSWSDGRTNGCFEFCLKRVSILSWSWDRKKQEKLILRPKHIFSTFFSCLISSSMFRVLSEWKHWNQSCAIQHMALDRPDINLWSNLHFHRIIYRSTTTNRPERWFFYVFYVSSHEFGKQRQPMKWVEIHSSVEWKTRETRTWKNPKIHGSPLHTIYFCFPKPLELEILTSNAVV